MVGGPGCFWTVISRGVSVVPGVGQHFYREHILRRAQKGIEKAIADQTATILRYTETGGTPSAGIAPTATRSTPTLADLPCSVSELGEVQDELRGLLLAPIQEDQRTFSFMDVPATTSPVVAAYTVLITDFILFEGNKYRPYPGSVINDPNTKISVIVANLWVRG